MATAPAANNSLGAARESTRPQQATRSDHRSILDRHRTTTSPSNRSEHRDRERGNSRALLAAERRSETLRRRRHKGVDKFTAIMARYEDGATSYGGRDAARAKSASRGVLMTFIVTFLFHVFTLLNGVILLVLLALSAGTVALVVVCVLSASTRTTRVLVAWLWRNELWINSLVAKEERIHQPTRLPTRYPYDASAQERQPLTEPPQPPQQPRSTRGREVTPAVMTFSLVYFLWFKWLFNIMFSTVPLTMWAIALIQVVPSLAQETEMAIGDTMINRVFVAMATSFFAYQISKASANANVAVSHKMQKALFHRSSTTPTERGPLLARESLRPDPVYDEYQTMQQRDEFMTDLFREENRFAQPMRPRMMDQPSRMAVGLNRPTSSPAMLPPPPPPPPPPPAPILPMQAMPPVAFGELPPFPRAIGTGGRGHGREHAAGHGGGRGHGSDRDLDAAFRTNEAERTHEFCCLKIVVKTDKQPLRRGDDSAGRGRRHESARDPRLQTGHDLDPYVVQAPIMTVLNDPDDPPAFATATTSDSSQHRHRGRTSASQAPSASPVFMRSCSCGPSGIRKDLRFYSRDSLNLSPYGTNTRMPPPDVDLKHGAHTRLYEALDLRPSAPPIDPVPREEYPLARVVDLYGSPSAHPLAPRAVPDHEPHCVHGDDLGTRKLDIFRVKQMLKEQAKELKKAAKRIKDEFRHEEKRRKNEPDDEDAVDQELQRLEEQRRELERQKRVLIEQKRAVKDQKRVLEQQKRVAEQQERVIEELNRLAKEQRRHQELERLAIEEQQRRVEDQRRASGAERSSSGRVRNPPRSTIAAKTLLIPSMSVNARRPIPIQPRERSRDSQPRYQAAPADADEPKPDDEESKPDVAELSTSFLERKHHIRERDEFAVQIEHAADEATSQQRQELNASGSGLLVVTTEDTSVSGDANSFVVTQLSRNGSSSGPTSRRPVRGITTSPGAEAVQAFTHAEDDSRLQPGSGAASTVSDRMLRVSGQYQTGSISDLELRTIYGTSTPSTDDTGFHNGVNEFAGIDFSTSPAVHVGQVERSPLFRYAPPVPEYNPFSPQASPTSSFRSGSFLETTYNRMSPTYMLPDADFPSEEFQQVYRSIRFVDEPEPVRTQQSMRTDLDDVPGKRDKVHFCSYAPPCVAPSKTTFRYAVWAFLLNQRHEMRERAEASDPSAKQLSIDTKMMLRRGAIVHVTLEVPEGFRILNGATQGFPWEGTISHVDYDIECTDGADFGQVLFKATIVVGVEVAVLRSYIMVASKKLEPGEMEARMLESKLEVLEKTFTEVPFQSLERKELVGQGYFGDAFRAIYQGEEVVVKTIRAQEFGETTDQILKEFQHEAAVLSMFGHHPCVVPFVGASTDPKYPLSLVTKYLPYGSLEDNLRKPDVSSHLSVRQKSSMLKDAAAGLLNIHEGGFIHRDIAARNCLVDDDLRVKICDFGLCRRAGAYGSTLMKDAVGPIKYMAPESLQAPHAFSYNSDAWMFGVLMWETFTASAPFEGVAPLEAGMRILRGERLPKLGDLPEELQSLMDMCFHESPTQRPTMSDLLYGLDEFVTQSKQQATQATPRAMRASSSLTAVPISTLEQRTDRTVFV